jgi:hypothetical protein
MKINWRSVAIRALGLTIAVGFILAGVFLFPWIIEQLG